MWVEGHYFKTPITAAFDVDPENGTFFDTMRGTPRYCISDENGVVFEVDPVTVGQSVNVYDIGGKVIFEGDILHTRDEFDDEAQSEVYLGDGAFVIQPKDGELMGVFHAVQACFGKVVGNIYDNPNLIESIEESDEE